jgi:AraC family transcriptional regulator
MAVDATLQTPLVIARLVRFDLTNPVDVVFPGTSAHWLYQFLTPKLRNSRLCYPERWNPRRFEPLGDIFLVPAEQTLHARGDSGSFGSIICQLHPDAMHRWFEDDMAWSERHLEAGLNIRSRNVRNLLLRLEEETRHPGFASEALAELIAGQLVIELAQYYNSIHDRPGACGLAPWRLQLIEERIMDLGEAPTLAELAAMCNLSVRQLTRAFRASRGRSIGDYIAECRMEKARALLERGESVKAVSYSMGFASPAAFGYAFRRATGEPPGVYQKRIRRAD